MKNENICKACGDPYKSLGPGPAIQWVGAHAHTITRPRQLHCPNRLRLQNTNSKKKLLRISGQQLQNIKPQA